MIKTLEWTDAGVVMVDQRLLPTEEVYPVFETYEEVAYAIKEMVVRGAPAIGVAAAMGVALGTRDAVANTAESLDAAFNQVCEVLGATRPTAVNLFWAIERMRKLYAEQRAVGASVADIRARLIAEAQAMHVEDVAANRAMGAFGAALIPDKATVLTHCNAGALATAGYGTALGVIRAAHAAGKRIRVLADETRPYLQGARLTSWELHRDGIHVEVITDSMAGHFFARGEIQFVVVGADRIAKNGDVANKIGTYSVAVLASAHHVPFTVAAPWSTVDLRTPDGASIPIEERSRAEVACIAGREMVGSGIGVRHPGFDITPARLIDAIFTERGMFRPKLGEMPEVRG